MKIYMLTQNGAFLAVARTRETLEEMIELIKSQLTEDYILIHEIKRIDLLD